MARMLAVILAVLLLAGCGAGASLPTATNMQPPLAAETTATDAKTPIPSPTMQATVSAEVTAAPEPTSTPEQITPETTASYPLVTITDLEPGPGRDVGILASSAGEYVYYHDMDENAMYSALYSYNLKTKKRQLIRRTESGSYIQTIFTDEAGRLYYVLTEEGEGNFIYRYEENGDKLLAGNVAKVYRVDHKYIYYDTWTATGTCVYSLTNGVVSIVENSDVIPDWNDSGYSIEWLITKTGTDFIIKGSKSIRKCHVNFKPQDSEFAYQPACYADANFLYIVDSDLTIDKSWIYKVDLKNGKIVSKKEINGNIHKEGITYYQGNIYFFSGKWVDESIRNQFIGEYNTKNGKVKVIKRFPDTDEFEHTYTVEAVAGELWIGRESLGDGPFYWYETTIPIQ